MVNLVEPETVEYVKMYIDKPKGEYDEHFSTCSCFTDKYSYVLDYNYYNNFFFNCKDCIVEEVDDGLIFKKIISSKMIFVGTTNIIEEEYNLPFRFEVKRVDKPIAINIYKNKIVNSNQIYKLYVPELVERLNFNIIASNSTKIYMERNSFQFTNEIENKINIKNPQYGNYYFQFVNGTNIRFNFTMDYNSNKIETIVDRKELFMRYGEVKYFRIVGHKLGLRNITIYNSTSTDKIFSKIGYKSLPRMDDSVCTDYEVEGSKDRIIRIDDDSVYLAVKLITDEGLEDKIGSNITIVNSIYCNMCSYGKCNEEGICICDSFWYVGEFCTESKYHNGINMFVFGLAFIYLIIGISFLPLLCKEGYKEIGKMYRKKKYLSIILATIFIPLITSILIFGPSVGYILIVVLQDDNLFTITLSIMLMVPIVGTYTLTYYIFMDSKKKQKN